MASYEDLKKKAKDALETIADVSVEAYKLAEEKARILAKKTKLNAEITREKAAIRRLKGNLGDKYYALHKDNPEEELKPICENISDAYARISANLQEIEELKKSAAECDCGCEAEADCCDAEAEAESEPAPEEENKTEY